MVPAMADPDDIPIFEMAMYSVNCVAETRGQQCCMQDAKKAMLTKTINAVIVPMIMEI